VRVEEPRLRARWLRWMTVPAVTEVWRPQSAHSRAGPIPFQFPPLATAAQRADEPVRPPAFDQISGASQFIGKPRLKGLARHRAI
jgi:hypothetical protein